MQSQFDTSCYCGDDAGSSSSNASNDAYNDYQVPRNRTTTFPSRSPFTTRVDDHGMKSIMLELPKHSAHTVQIIFRPKTGGSTGLTTTVIILRCLTNTH